MMKAKHWMMWTKLEKTMFSEVSQGIEMAILLDIGYQGGTEFRSL
jgi:hypothetical protein